MKPTLPTFLSALTSKIAPFKNLSCLVVVLLLSSGKVNAQFSVTTNSGSGLAPTYTSLANAITALNAATISSPVVITCPTGTEAVPAAGYVITAQGTSTNTIIIQGNGAANSIITGGSGVSTTTFFDAFFALRGADWVTIKGFAMTQTASTTALEREIGVALLHASVTNGAQNNTIQNNTITLNKTNLNTWGIYSNNNHSATTAWGTAEVVTNNTTGPASGNKVYNNIITNVNMGIAFLGTTTAANQDIGNDVGGTSAGTGNTITNWGGAGATNSPVGNSGTSYCIMMNHQVGDNVSYNTITSATISGTSVSLRGIFKDYTTAGATIVGTTNITNNTITITDNFISGTLEHIRTQGTVANTSTLNINNNTILNSSMGGASSSTSIVGIVNSEAVGTLSMSSNIIQGTTSTATTGGFTGVSNTGAVVTTITMNSNQIGNASGNAITFSAATSGSVLGVNCSGGAATAVLTMTGNDIRGIVHSVAGSAAHTYILNSSATLSQNISSNTFTNLNVNTTGSVTFISNNVSAPSAGSKTINGNSIVTAFNKGSAGGTVSLYSDGGSSVATAGIQNNNNNFSNITVTGATTIAGWNNVDGTAATPQKTITGNTFNNWTCGSGNVNALQVSYGGTTNVSTNTITNITGTGIITGFLQGSSGTIATLTIASNTITGLSSTGTGGAVTGISNASPATTTNINGNTINNLSSTSTTATVAGITTSVTANIFQNTINTLSCVGTTSGVTNGIMVTGGTTVNIYRNKIYDLATTGAFTTAPGVNGIVLSAGTTVNTFNNLIGDLKATTATSTDAIRGISITSSTASTSYNVYNNSVYLSGSGGANFGTSGIYHAASTTATTAALDLQNNMIFNTCTPSGTGIVTAFRRSAAATLGNYATSSNKNLFYAGTPSATTTIMSDGTNNYQTLATFQTAVSTREANSFTESAFTPSTYFVSTTASNANYLQPASGITTQAEGGGNTITMCSPDYNGVTRPGFSGAAYDVGAWEFAGVSPAPVLTSMSPSPALTAQCTKAARVISIDITTASGTITGATLNYNHNGTAQTAVTMTNSSGTIWSGTMLAPSTGNATVTWSITATNSLGLNTLYSGTSYADEPTTGITATATATPSTVCEGSNASLSFAINPLFTELFNTSTTSQFNVVNTAGTGTSTQNTTYFSEGVSSTLLNTASTSADVQLSQTNAVSLVNSSSATLTFSHICATESSYDFGYVEYSTNNGTSWTTFPANSLTSYNSGASGVYGSLVKFATASYTAWSTLFTSSSITPGTGPATALWKNETITIPSAALTSSQFKIRFRYTTDTGNNYYGWLIDNVKINTVQNVSAYSWSNGSTVVGTTNPLSTPITSGLTYTATATVNGCPMTAAVTPTVLPLPTAPTATPSSQCGAGVPSASVADNNSFTTPTFKWYSAASGGTALQTSTSNTYTTLISTTSTFYVSVVGTNSCESSRTAVVVTVTQPDAISATASAATICLDQSLTLTAANTATTPTQNYSYSWVCATTGSGATTANTNNPASVTPTAAGSYTYTVTGTDGACSVVNTVAVTVNSLPSAITFSPASATICNGSSQSIVASGGINNPIYFSENFNSGLSAWTITNSGTSPSVSNWVSQSAPLTDASGSATFSNFSTTNGGMFAYANPDAGGSGTTTNTVLQSPSFNTLGAASATLTFEHVYRKYTLGDQTTALEISIDNGATWTVLKDYKTLGSQGTTTNSAQVTANESITLSNTYLNQASVKIRYNYVSAWGYFWLIDNIKVSEIQSNTMSWSPTTSLYTDAGTTIAYTGNPRTVYAKPTTTTTYTATATNAAGCTSSNTVTITVTPTNTSGTASSSPTLCISTPLTAITHTTSGATGIGTSTGLPTGVTVAWASNTITISGTPTASGTFNYTIPLTGGCGSVNATGTITVTPNNTVGTVSANPSLCINTALTDITRTTTGATGIETATGLPAGVSASWASNTLTISGTPTAGGTFNYSIPLTGGCGSVNAIGTITVISDKTWLGTTDNSWNTASNWSCGTLPSASDVIIISSGSPVLDTNFTVGAGGSLTISGTSTTFTISPTSTLTVTGTANFGGKAVTIKSNSSGNGAIGQVTGTNLTGATNVTVERYIPAKRSWRAITAPVTMTTSINANWQEGSPVTGNGYGFDIWSTSGGTGIITGGTGSSLLAYDSTTNNTWSAITNTTSASSMMDGSKNKPFMAFVTGPYGTNNVTAGATETTLRATGTLLTGDKTYATVANKYTFIGNPYASPLDLTVVLNNTSNATTSFGGNVWVWDANVLGTYSVGTYNLFDFAASNYSYTSSNANISGAQIQSGQAFFVKSTDGANFSIKETHKGSVFTNAVFRSAAPEIMRVNLYKQVNNEWAGRDGTMTVILADANANQTPNKMANGTENIVFTKNGGNFASNHHLPLVATDVLNVKVWNTSAGANYKLKINTEQFTTTNLDATLEDLYTNARTPLALDGTAVEYPFSVTTDALSTGDRFRIVFQTSTLGTTIPTATGFSIVPNPVTGDSFQVNLGSLATGTYSYSICNAIGQEVEKGSINTTTQNTNYTVKFRETAATGIYIMKIKGSDNSVFTAKLIKK